MFQHVRTVLTKISLRCRINSVTVYAKICYNHPIMAHRLHIYWFSGSGNTLRLAETFAEHLRQQNWAVELRPLEHSDPQTIDPESTLGLAFPTHCFTIPANVLAFVRSLPHVENTEAIMLGTHGGFSGGVVGPLKRKLTAKGFRCTAARIIAMPDSFFPFTSDETNRRKIEQRLNYAKNYADDFATGKASWTRWAILCDIYAALFSGLFAIRKGMPNHYYSTIHAQAEQCKRCGSCVQCCPVNALERNADMPPKPKRNCTNCLRCVAVCPADAMRHLIGFRPYRSEEASVLQQRFKTETH